MAIPTNKTELINDIKSTYAKVRPEFDIDKSLVNEKTMTGQIKDSKMSVHNLASYLLGWGEMMLDWDRAYRATGEVPDFQISNYGKLAQKFYQDYAGIEYDVLLKKLDETVEKIIKMLDAKTNQQLYEKIWYTTKSSNKDYTFGRLVQFNTSSPYRNAYSRMRKWKKEEKKK